MDAASIIGALRLALSGLIVASGLVLLAGGALGLLRFPDLYTRLHAANVADVAGTALMIAGLAVVAPDWSTVVRLVMLAALVVAVGPTLTQLVASGAHSAGLAPIAGKYSAPRPGATRPGGA